MKFKNDKGYSLTELLIIVAIVGILLSALVNGATGNPKQNCISSGGKWTEGIQYGRITQLCTYN